MYTMSIIDKAYEIFDDQTVIQTTPLQDKINYIQDNVSKLEKLYCLNIAKIIKKSGLENKLYKHPEGIQFDTDDINNDTLNEIYNYIKIIINDMDTVGE
jgi:Bromodomain extra-terminal - transcription regulation